MACDVPCLQSSSGAGGGCKLAEGGGNGKTSAKEGSDFWWDIAGWVTLIGLGLGVVALSKGGPTPAAPPPMPAKS